MRFYFIFAAAIMLGAAISFLAQMISGASAAVALVPGFLAALAGVITNFIPDFSSRFEKLIGRKRRLKEIKLAKSDFLLRFTSDEKQYDVFVISAINYDYSIKVPTIIPNSETVAAEIGEGPGGSGANTAYCLGHLGRTVSVCGVIGNDTNSSRIQEDFRDAKVKTDFVFTSTKKTGETIILVDQLGRRLITVIPHSNLDLHTSLNDKNIATILSSLNSYKVMHFSSFTNPEQMLRPVSKMLDNLPPDIIVSYAPGDLQSFISKSGLGSKIIGRSDIIFFYEHQIARNVNNLHSGRMTDIELKSVVDAFCTYKEAQGGPPVFLICVKRSETEAAVQSHRPEFNLFLYNKSSLEIYKTSFINLPDEIVYVDGTGANDAAAAGLLHALLSGKDLQTAIDEASHLSLLIASEIGPRKGIGKIARSG